MYAEQDRHHLVLEGSIRRDINLRHHALKGD
jgi:hypothetical protein